VVRERFLHIAFFALARLDQRHGYFLSPVDRARPHTTRKRNPRMTKHPLIPLSADPARFFNPTE
jgi:hypothetical protein